VSLILLPAGAGCQCGHEKQPGEALVAQFRQLHGCNAVHRDAEEPHAHHAGIEDHHHPQAVVQLSRPCQPVGGEQGHSQEEGAGPRTQEIDGLRHTGCADAKAGDVLQGFKDVKIGKKQEDQQSIDHNDPREPESGVVHVIPLIDRHFDEQLLAGWESIGRERLRVNQKVITVYRPWLI